MNSRYDITLTSNGDNWHAITEVRVGENYINIGGWGFDEKEDVAIMDALAALGRTIISHRAAYKKLQQDQLP